MKFLAAFLALLVLIEAAPNGPSVKIDRNPRIIGGDEAEEGEFPHQVSIQVGLLGLYEHSCGGSILNENWILTAAHCIQDTPFLSTQIVAGVTKLSDSGAQTRDVAKTIVHSEYGGDVGPNDIALIQLSKPLELNDKVKPINLPTPGQEFTGDVTLSGWGVTSNSVLPSIPDHLQTITIPVVEDAECRTAIDSLLDESENPFNEDSNVCTGPLTGGSGACSGDSGGPLIQDDTIVGVVSWGFIPCGSNGAPSVFTQVSTFVDFIEKNIK